MPDDILENTVGILVDSAQVAAARAALKAYKVGAAGLSQAGWVHPQKALDSEKPFGYGNHMVSKKDHRRDRVFRAISDPTRREILGILRGGGKTVGGIAQNFRMSRPAISKHLRLLHHAGLVAIRKEGTASICTLDAQPLRQVNDWLINYEVFWTESLQSLKKHMEEEE